MTAARGGARRSSTRGLLLSAALLLPGCPAPPPPAPTASIRLVRAGDRHAEVVACVASITGWDPSLALRLVDRAPVTLPGLTPTVARDGAEALSALGAVAHVVSTTHIRSSTGQ